MKYAYRLMKDTFRIQYELQDAIFPVSDDMDIGMHRQLITKGLMEYIFVFRTKGEAEASIKYERYACSCRKLTYQERLDLMEWECKRIRKLTQLNTVEDVLGIHITTPGRQVGRYIPGERYMARIHAVADILERHFDAMRKELAPIIPDDRLRKED